MTVRVVVADDQEVVRAGFGALLGTQPDLAVVATASDGAETVEACREHRPDVVLMDVRMPVMDGIEATRRVTADPDPPRVLMLTTFDLDEHVYDALVAAPAASCSRTSPPSGCSTPSASSPPEGAAGPAVTRRLIGEFARLRPARPNRTSWTPSPRARPRCCAWSPTAWPTPRSPPASSWGRRR